MEKEENIIEELKKIYPSDKKKKKFVYLDKYETYKEHTDDVIKAMQQSINIGYVGMGVLAIWLLLITLTK
jgi:hypothetical protein